VAEVTLTHALNQIRGWCDYIQSMPAQVIIATPTTSPSVTKREIAWGAKVSPLFKERVLWIEQDLGVNADYLMACMAWESGESFSPSKKNMAGSGATGLIQFMPSTARSLGTTTEALAQMTAEDQLNYVWKYFAPFKGRLNNLGDVYMAILWPKGVGKPDSYVVFDSGIAYRQNAGLDINKDGDVTRGECLSKIQDKLAKGLKANYVG
jgi:hypothetical protein